MQAEIANIRSETVQRNVETTASALESAATIITGVQAPAPVPGTPATESSPGTPDVPGRLAEPLPTVPPLADRTELSTVADAILASAGFEDSTEQEDGVVPDMNQIQQPEQMMPEQLDMQMPPI